MGVQQRRKRERGDCMDSSEEGELEDGELPNDQNRSSTASKRGGANSQSMRGRGGQASKKFRRGGGPSTMPVYSTNQSILTQSGQRMQPYSAYSGTGTAPQHLTQAPMQSSQQQPWGAAPPQHMMMQPNQIPYQAANQATAGVYDQRSQQHQHQPQRGAYQTPYQQPHLARAADGGQTSQYGSSNQAAYYHGGQQQAMMQSQHQHQQQIHHNQHHQQQVQQQQIPQSHIPSLMQPKPQEQQPLQSQIVAQTQQQQSQGVAGAEPTFTLTAQQLQDIMMAASIQGFNGGNGTGNGQGNINFQQQPPAN